MDEDMISWGKYLKIATNDDQVNMGPATFRSSLGGIFVDLIQATMTL